MDNMDIRRPNDSHDKISPTAKLVAYSRQFSDIPFASEIARMSRAEETTRGLFEGSGVDPKEFIDFAPMVEARYKSLLSHIRKSGIKQVLEFASGLSFRGLVMSDDPEMVYVESDLPGIVQEKQNMLRDLPSMAAVVNRGNVFFHAANILDAREIEPTLSHFAASKPVAVIHEGLFQYLTIEEKKRAGRNIRAILARFGGLWMTPDLHTKNDMNSQWRNNERVKRFSGAIAKHTLRNFEENSFEDEAHLERFMRDIGFRMSVSPQIDGSFELTTIDRLKVNKDIWNEVGPKLRVWTMEPI